MNPVDSPNPAPLSPDERTAALFAGLVLNQAQMAAMLMGAFPHPETGEHMRDLEAARMFIDQLEMLETKTRGNLSPEEDRLLKQNLVQLRLLFVEAVQAPAPAAEAKPSSSAAAPAPAPASEASADDPAGKRFTKKY